MAATRGIYLDSALIAKFYLNEPGRDVVRALARSAGRVASSSIAVAEVSAAFHRKLREQAIGSEAFIALQGQFSNDLRAAIWTLSPVSDAILDDVRELFTKLPAGIYLRSVDALHLVSARVEGFRSIHSNDRHVLAAAAAAGLSGVNPLA